MRDDWKRGAFDDERKARVSHFETNKQSHYIKRSDGWILFGPLDVRSRVRTHFFSLQMLDCDKVVRVRAGCRFKTLEQAFKHWEPKRGDGPTRRNEKRQALAIISLMVSQAQAYGLMPMYTSRRGKRPVTTTIKLEPKRKK